MNGTYTYFIFNIQDKPKNGSRCIDYLTKIFVKMKGYLNKNQEYPRHTNKSRCTVQKYNKPNNKLNLKQDLTSLAYILSVNDRLKFSISADSVNTLNY